MSEPIYERASEHLRSVGTQAMENLEGLGEVTTYYVDLEQIMHTPPAELEPSRVRRLVAWAKMAWRSVPYLLGWRKACDGFRNAPTAG